jgi:HSP90 family molecular chaperone
VESSVHFRKKNQNSVNGVIKDMSKLMKENFDKYWKDYSEILAFGAILDPHLKEFFLKYCYTKLDASISQPKLKKVMDKFKVLYEECAS